MRASAAQSEAERGQQRAEISKRLAKALNSKVLELESSLAAQRRSDSAREGVAEVLVDHAKAWQTLMRSVGGISPPRNEPETTASKVTTSP